MTDRILRTLVEQPCRILHHTWRIPYWNQIGLLACPIAAACHRWPRFADWYFHDPATGNTPPVRRRKP